jgi:hypothetical protein
MKPKPIPSQYKPALDSAVLALDDAVKKLKPILGELGHQMTITTSGIVITIKPKGPEHEKEIEIVA